MFIAILLFIAGCFEGAPRRHPLDPQGENFNDAGGLSVHVTSYYAPRQSISEATVLLTPGSFIGTTDSEGRVFIPDLATGSYNITVEKDGYAPQTKPIEVAAGETSSLEIPIPGLPAFKSIDINTIHISRWWPPPEELLRLSISVEIEDPDGPADIEEVWVEIPDFEFRQSLDIQAEPGFYQQTIKESDLPVSLAAVIGHEVFIYARDRIPTLSSSKGHTISRIINTSPLAITPQGLQLLDTSTPLLTWESVATDYPFSYQLDIVRVDNNVENLIASIAEISSDSSSILINALPTGQYFWTVSIVDEFGNKSRSREAGFRIP